jgi:hypothetical protein
MRRWSIRLDPSYWVAIAVAIAFVALSARIVPDKTISPIALAQVLAHIFYLQDDRCSAALGLAMLASLLWSTDLMTTGLWRGSFLR